MNRFLIENNRLKIIPSATSSENDFDFLVGKWKVKNRKLKERLANCTDWDEFNSEIHLQKVLNGLGNIERYLSEFDGKAFEGMAVRLFKPDTKLWTIYWVDTSNTQMDNNPVAGSFENGIGRFYTTINFKGVNVIMLYQWDAVNPQNPVWSQAYSADNGNTWEWNWYMHLEK